MMWQFYMDEFWFVLFKVVIEVSDQSVVVCVFGCFVVLVSQVVNGIGLYGIGVVSM